MKHPHSRTEQDIAEHLTFIKNTNGEPKADPWATPTYQDIHRSLNFAKTNGGLAMIAGAPGSGKTRAALNFIQKNTGVFMISMVAREAAIFNLAGKLMAALDMGEPNSRRLPEARLKITEEIGFEGQQMIIVDEAQYLVHKNPRGGVSYDAINLLHQIAKRYGGLADVCNVIQHAQLFEGRETVTNAALAVAIEDLKLDWKGGL